MTASTRIAFRLETRWTPAIDNEPLSYRLMLTNLSGAPVEGFRLCVSGPARIDPAATIEGGDLAVRLSNHAEFVPPEGDYIFSFDPGEASAEVKVVEGKIPAVERHLAAVGPHMTDEFKMPNSCTACHTDKSTDWNWRKPSGGLQPSSTTGTRRPLSRPSPASS